MSNDVTPMTVMDVDAVLGILPHRYPFLLVDRVLELERGVRIVAVKAVSADEPYFAGATPGALAMPGLLIVEALAQAGAILLLSEQEAGSLRLAYFASLDSVEWPSVVFPGDVVRLEISVAKRRGRLHKVHGRATVGGTVVCEADLGAVVVDQ
jgi:3-hydroxyacyl-[acyl-carrier-protein] dehydratase